MNIQGPHLQVCRMNKLSIIGDSIIKNPNVDFEKKLILYQFIQDSPPKQFRKETTQIELYLNESD